MHYYNIVVFSLKKISLTYKSESDNLIGAVVLIDLRGKKCYGIVILKQNNFEYLNKNFSIKKIESVLIEKFFTDSFISFLSSFCSLNVATFEDIALMSISVLANFLTLKNKDKFLSQLNIPGDRMSFKKLYNDIKLNDLQVNTVNKFFQNFDINSYRCTLIDGSTGSGKTYIYCHLALELLKKYNDIQILIMLPEISLSKYFVDKISTITGIGDLAIWNSSLSVKEKKNIFCKIKSGQTRLIIGTRSSIFIPYKNLKFIIVDEEHDSSYKQDSQIIYQGRDMAVLLAKKTNIQILLSSATPSISTYNNAVNLKKYFYLEIKSRYNEIKMPDIYLIDKSSSKIISDKSIDQIRHFLDLKKKVLIFINRRGYSRMLICKDCGCVLECENCDNKLSYHKSKATGICHYCNYSIDISDSTKCSKCESDDISTFGSFGVEKVFQFVKGIFDKNKIKIFSSDTIKDSYEDVDIMIGTQIISKGYTFQNLNFCLILDYDGYVGKNNIYKNEILFQNITQVCGRVGRDNSDKSEIFLEVNKNDFSAFNLLNIIKNYKKHEFYENEIKYRKSNLIYPFFFEIGIYFTSGKEDELKDFSSFYLQNMKNIILRNKHNNVIEVIGVEKFSIYRLFNRFRVWIVLRSANYMLIRKYCFEMQNLYIRNKIFKKGNIKIKYDSVPDGLI